jgi:Mrp family chromosome partitioning ATPase
MDESFEPTLFGAARAHAVLVALCALGGLVAFVILGVIVLNDQVATASVLVEDPRGATVFDPTAIRDPSRYVADQVAIIESGGIARTAAEIVGPPLVGLAVPELLDRREVSSNPESSLIEVSVTSKDPDLAVDFSTAIITAYRDLLEARTAQTFDNALAELDASISAVDDDLEALDEEIVAVSASSAADEELRETIDELISLINSNLTTEQLQRALQEAQLAQLVRQVESQSPQLATLIERRTHTLNQRAQLVLRRDQVSVDAAIANSGVVLFSPAEEADRSMGLGRLAAIGLLLGLAAGVAVAYAISKRARRFQNRFEPELLLGAPLLSEVPAFDAEGLDTPLPIRDAPLSAAAEAYRFAGAALMDSIASAEMSELGLRPQIFAVTSPLVGDGKTVTTANLAAALATKGRRVMLIDADFGDQALTELLSDHAGWYPGLTDMVEVGISLTSAVRSVHVRDGLVVDVLSRGSQSIAAPEFFRRPAVADRFAEIRESYDLILVDVPPMLQVAYSGSVVRLCDGVVVVVSHGGGAPALTEAADRIRLIGKPVHGYIYNKAPLREELSTRRGSMRDPLGLGIRSETD